MARRRAGARRAPRGPRSAGSACPGRCTGSSRSTRPDRRAAAGDPLERPAHRRGVRRDRGALGLEELIALTGNRALTGFTAPKLLWMRRHEPDLYARIASLLLPKDYVRLRLCGEKATDVDRRLRDPAVRRRPPALDAAVLAALELDEGWLPRGARVPRPPRARCGRSRGGRRGRSGGGRAGRRSRPAGTGLRRARHVGRRVRPAAAFATDPQARVHAFCHAVPGTWHAMGVMLSAAGSLRWLRTSLPRATVRRAPRRGGRWEPGARGSSSCPTCQASGRRTPTRTHAVPSSASGAPRPRRARARGARGRRVRAARLARARGDGRGAGRGPHLGRWCTLGVCGYGSWPRCSSSRWSARSPTRERRTGRRCSAAWPGASGRTSREAVAATLRIENVIDPDPAWSAVYAELHPRYRALYPAMRLLDDATVES